tara:strand:+ start:93 stop:248 length:156 start_codon:yes stop_codon:yes gene_type:complete
MSENLQELGEALRKEEEIQKDLQRQFQESQQRAFPVQQKINAIAKGEQKPA